MNFEPIRIVDVLTILAIFIGPIIAVQITRWIDSRKENRSRRLAIYRTLMATRAVGLSQEHIQALNMIDVEFSKKSDNDRSIRTAWKVYLDHLNDRTMPSAEWGIRRVDRLVSLLSAMGRSLGYDFDEVHIKNGVYSPAGHGEIEADQTEIRRGLRQLLEGTRTVPVNIVNLPPQQLSQITGEK